MVPSGHDTARYMGLMKEQTITWILWCGVILCLAAALVATAQLDDPLQTSLFSLPPILVFWTVDALVCGTFLIILATRHHDGAKGHDSGKDDT